MKTNPLKRLLRDGQPAIGTWVSARDATLAEHLAAVGFDWLAVDMGHAAIDWRHAADLIRAIAGQGCAPLVRVPWNAPEHIQRALDAGGWGVLVPMVCTPDEAEAAAAAAKYPPVGSRTFGGERGALSFGTDAATYFERANEEIVVVAQVEHAEAIRNIEKICRVAGLDACLVGPTDFLASIGKPPLHESKEPAYAEALRAVLAACREFGVAPGLHVLTGTTAARRIAEGFRFVAISGDVRMLLAIAREHLLRARGSPSDPGP
jgi:4-hydroxy-2-oxoheptanedioate aldolase